MTRSGWSEEQTHLSLGQKGLTSARQRRSTHPVDLSVRRGMPAKRGAGVALALPAASSRRDRHQGHPPAATPFSFSIKPADMVQKDLRVPSSISLLPLSPRHAPSSTARKTSGSSCVRTGCRTASSNLFNDIVDHCCYAWNTLIDQSWKISPSLIAIRPLSVTLCED